MKRAIATPKARAGFMALPVIVLLLTPNTASAQVYNTIASNMSAVGSPSCQTAETNAISAGRYALQQQTANIQTSIVQPGDLNSESCIGSLLSSAQGLYNQLAGLAGGMGGIGSMLSGMIGSLINGIASQACSMATSQWNSVSGSINSVADLPNTLGSAASGYAQSAAGGLVGRGSSGMNSFTGSLTNAPSKVTGTITNSLGSLF